MHCTFKTFFLTQKVDPTVKHRFYCLLPLSQIKCPLCRPLSAAEPTLLLPECSHTHTLPSDVANLLSPSIISSQHLLSLLGLSLPHPQSLFPPYPLSCNTLRSLIVSPSLSIVTTLFLTLSYFSRYSGPFSLLQLRSLQPNSPPTISHLITFVFCHPWPPIQIQLDRVMNNLQCSRETSQFK